MADKRARIELEDKLTDTYILVAVAPDEDTGNAIFKGLMDLGFHPSMTCGCGSYGYGECELCNDPETEPSTTIDDIEMLGVHPVDTLTACGDQGIQVTEKALTDLGPVGASIEAAEAQQYPLIGRRFRTLVPDYEEDDEYGEVMHPVGSIFRVATPSHVEEDLEVKLPDGTTRLFEHEPMYHVIWEGTAVQGHWDGDEFVLSLGAMPVPADGMWCVWGEHEMMLQAEEVE